MAILAFQKPDKVIMLESTDKFGKFEFRPLEPGYGITIGNPLRRILLSSLEGFAITGIKIHGVEDVEDEKLTVLINGQEAFKAGDINKFLTGFEVLNTELVICHMDPSVNFQMEITIQKGRGYVPSTENMPAEAEAGFIPIDAIYTPIRNVKYEIENYRVEGKTDYEKLLFEIETDGSIAPTDALKEAAKILIHHFMLFSDEKISLESEDKYGNEEFDEEVLHMRQLLKTKLVDMDLSVRALNCLKAAEVETLGELCRFNKNDLLKFRNFGKKSLTELEALLENNNLEFGMDVTKYKLDKE